MSSFAEVMATNPPRLVVLYQRSEDGTDVFQWGLVGIIPILSLISSVARAKHELIAEEWMPECGEQPAFVITWDDKEKWAQFWLHPDVPTEPLVGMLSVIEMTIIGGRLGQQAAAQRVLGPDGLPWRK